MRTAINAAQTSTETNGRPRLLAAAPIVAVSEELERHVGELRRLAPASDATTALTLYRDKLAAALVRARNVELFVAVDVAAAILGKSPSGVTYLCRSGSLKAKKVGGVWQIDRADLERVRADDAASPPTDPVGCAD
ncbi:MAG TPA: helix-turn-helix domain-containing protein [Gemmatimonadaceae bacterium]|jgi:helix-turn-helix protein|nr:helix-turn-helix domain-containing protein [Gemmatimonadaceae bacterium]